MDGGGVPGFGEVDRFEHDVGIRRAQRVTRHHGRQLGHPTDVPNADHFGGNVILPIREEGLADPFIGPTRAVFDVRVRRHRAGEDAEEGHPTNVRVGHGLEGQCGKGTVFVSRKLTFRPVDSGRLLPVRSVREFADNRGEERLDTAGVLRGAAQHGRDGTILDAAAKLAEEFLVGDLLVIEVAEHQLLIVLSDAFDDGLAMESALLGQLLWNRDDLDRPCCIVAEHHGCVAQEVDDSLEGAI